MEGGTDMDKTISLHLRQGIITCYPLLSGTLISDLAIIPNMMQICYTEIQRVQKKRAGPGCSKLTKWLGW